MSFESLQSYFQSKNVVLVAVSKTKPVSAIQDLYDKGQRIFGENRVQEILEKKDQLPNDIEWHLIGHLQTNKVKAILPHVKLIHSVDSEKLLLEINKEARKISKIQDLLLQIYIAQEETKFGLGVDELENIFNNYLNGKYDHIRIQGLMGMASFVEDDIQIKSEFSKLKSLFDQYNQRLDDSMKMTTLSMGMSGDYEIAIECGSNMVRIGSLLFGSR